MHGTADTPHPFAGAAVCYGAVMQCAAWSGTAQQTRRASSGARKFARKGVARHGAARPGPARPGEADTQRPAMAVAVCWARLGGAMRGAARHGKNIRLITGKLYEIENHT